MISLIKSLSHTSDGQANGSTSTDNGAGPADHQQVQLPSHVKASEQEQAIQLQVLSDPLNGLVGHQLPVVPAIKDSRTLVIVDTDAAIANCFAALKELRPHLEREGFVQRIKLQQEEGYQYV